MLYKKIVGLDHSLEQTNLAVFSQTVPAIGSLPQVCARCMLSNLSTAVGCSKSIDYHQLNTYRSRYQYTQARSQTYVFHVIGERRGKLQLESSSSLIRRLVETCRFTVARQHLGNTVAASRRSHPQTPRQKPTNTPKTPEHTISRSATAPPRQ